MEILESDYYYHIYNRGNGKVNLFVNEDNYYYFLSLMRKYILPVADIYAYCLLPNHFHFLIRIKDDVQNPSQAFSNYFNAYSKAFNKQEKRSGSLFQRPFKRIKIDTEDYLRSLLVYIHCNSEIHGITADFSKYIYSSYQTYFSNSPTSIKREVGIGWFNDLENFKFMHENKVFHLKEVFLLE